MKNYFDNEINRIKLKNSCEKWLKTPYLHGGNSLGGIDCAKLIGKILIECGVITGIEEKKYSKDWATHSQKNILVESVEDSQRFSSNCALKKITYNENYIEKVGDIVAIATCSKEIAGHLAIVCANRKIFHCIQYLGCRYSQLNDFWLQKINSIYRILEKEKWE